MVERVKPNGPRTQTTQEFAAPRYSDGTRTSGSHSRVDADSARSTSEASRLDWSCIRTVT